MVNNDQKWSVLVHRAQNNTVHAGATRNIFGFFVTLCDDTKTVTPIQPKTDMRCF